MRNTALIDIHTGDEIRSIPGHDPTNWINLTVCGKNDIDMKPDLPAQVWTTNRYFCYIDLVSYQQDLQDGCQQHGAHRCGLRAEGCFENGSHHQGRFYYPITWGNERSAVLSAGIALVKEWLNLPGPHCVKAPPRPEPTGGAVPPARE